MARSDGHPPVLDIVLEQERPAGKLLRAYRRRAFLNALALLRAAGVPAREALQKKVNSRRSAELRTASRGTINSLEGDATLAAG
jgi:hypothetical protein